MRKSFKVDNIKYTYIPSDKFDINKIKLSNKKYRFEYLEIACAFDIDTTSY